MRSSEQEHRAWTELHINSLEVNSCKLRHDSHYLKCFQKLETVCLKLSPNYKALKWALFQTRILLAHYPRHLSDSPSNRNSYSNINMFKHYNDIIAGIVQLTFMWQNNFIANKWHKLKNWTISIYIYICIYMRVYTYIYTHLQTCLSYLYTYMDICFSTYYI